MKRIKVKGSGSGSWKGRLILNRDCMPRVLLTSCTQRQTTESNGSVPSLLFCLHTSYCLWKREWEVRVILTLYACRDTHHGNTEALAVNYLFILFTFCWLFLLVSFSTTHTLAIAPPPSIFLFHICNFCPQRNKDTTVLSLFVSRYCLLLLSLPAVAPITGTSVVKEGGPSSRFLRLFILELLRLMTLDIWPESTLASLHMLSHASLILFDLSTVFQF